eukprot:evm.model.NODE_3177_length_20199_cov_24.013615.5
MAGLRRPRRACAGLLIFTPLLLLLIDVVLAFTFPYTIPRQRIRPLHTRGGAGDKERIAKFLKLKKIKEGGGDYNRLLEGEGAGSSSALDEDFYYDDDKNGDAAGVTSGDYSAEDQEMYDELKRQEKQALVDKILKAKAAGLVKPSSSSSSSSAPNKGQPSPYLSRKMQQQQEVEERFQGVETYKPQSSSWGEFARPKNIPEAFGGGVHIPEGGVSLKGDKEWLAKYDDLMAQVREYKKEVQGAVLTPLEKEDEERINVARGQARRFMLRGEYEAAKDVLLPFRNICSVRSALGASTLMDLAMAYEALYEFKEAQEIYTQVRSSPVKDLRVKAKALNLGAEAMKKLGLGSKSNVNPRNIINFAYIPGQIEGSYGLYMKGNSKPNYDDAPAKPRVESVAHALELLEDAVIAQGVGISFDTINAALRAVHQEILRGDDAAGGPKRRLAPLPEEELDGRWRCRVTSYQESVEFLTKVNVWQRVETAAGTITGQLVVAPFEVIRDVNLKYTFDPFARVLNYGAQDNMASAFGLPTGLPHTLRVLALSDTLMVTARSSDKKGSTPRASYDARFAIWTRAG